MFAADYAAAFGSLDHNFILSSLKLFNFPEYFINWIRILQTDMQSSVINHGYSTGYFPVTRGCRQGDPISPYIFILAIEILFVMIQNDQDIKGITVSGLQIKVIMFADDTTFFLKDIHSLKKLENIISIYEKFTSLQLNNQKSEIAWLGPNNGLPAPSVPYKWIDLTRECIKILGIYFTYNAILHGKYNFDNTIERFKSTLRHWKLRNLTLYGKVTIVKTLGIPQIRYVCNVLVPPEYFISNIKNIIVDFVWSGGSSKIKYNAIINDKSEGGLSLPDIESIVKTRRIIWLKQIFDERNCLWQIIPRFYFNMIGIPRIDINLNVTWGIDKIPIFYRACLLDWNILFMNEPTDYTNVLAQPLWNNRFITSNNMPIYFKDMSEAGLNHIADIVTDDGKLQSFDKLGLPDCKIFEWLILKHSIRKHWLEMVQIEGLPQKKL